MLNYRKGYVDVAEQQQLHYHRWHNDRAAPTLICLPPVPYGGGYFGPLANALANRNIDLVAVDPPGFGASTYNPSKHPAIETTATAVATLSESLRLNQPELLGFHSGSIIALAVASIINCKQLHLIDVPAYTKDERNDLLAQTPTHRRFGTSMESIEGLWRFNVERHGDALSPERAIAMLADDLLASTHQPLGFRATFSYDWEACLPDLSGCRIRLVATNGILRAPTEHFAATVDQLGGMQLDAETWDHVTARVFDDHANRVAAWLSRSLS